MILFDIDFMANVIIRNASIEDAPLVARCTMAAIGIYDFSFLVPETEEFYRKLVEVCSRTDTLYSYANSRVVFIGETAIGCLISYPGDNYIAARELTFGLLDFDGSDTEIETEPGEYYLDSMAILPSFRGNSIGKVLLTDGIDRGLAQGYKKVTLIVSKDKPRLHDYYLSIGFKDVKELKAFGEDYIKMAFS